MNGYKGNCEIQVNETTSTVVIPQLLPPALHGVHYKGGARESSAPKSVYSAQWVSVDCILRGRLV